MSRRRQIYEGKAKVLFEGPEPGTIVQYFKDDATAFNAQKKDVITGKGVLNNQNLVEPRARYLYKTDRLKTAALSYRASYSLQQACQAKPALPTEKIGTFP